MEKPKHSFLFSVRQYMKEIYIQSMLLTWKNLIILSRNPKMLLFQVFTPGFICIYLYLV